jgi:hypothetical protein
LSRVKSICISLLCGMTIRPAPHIIEGIVGTCVFGHAGVIGAAKTGG